MLDQAQGVAKLLTAGTDTAEIDGLAEDLCRHGYAATAVFSGAAVLQSYHDADLVLLDLGLQDVDGLSVCRQIRRNSYTPIIAFTENRTEADRVLGLQAGADDCLDKPYTLRELVARIDALLRRTYAAKPQPAVRPEGESTGTSGLVRGDLNIDLTTRQVDVSGCPVELTRKEFDLLYLLASEPGVVFTRQQLMAELWDVPREYSAAGKGSRTIDTHVSALRRKLGSAHWIYTVRGVGFSFRSGDGPAEALDP
ncbi:hypothetical protein BJF85_11180 [Saccharomonospora sp. CUA-673]|uniref:response regulator transcription factor n=1 Tax=Saccharomonospora sp. CUA-673 TaxID=1904969 RepID=UPI0009620DAD|nr:response regulator transcription factor [Saccharomonospora sp. CUA-673]OLT48995.1 hypothetical protein BJF85_11180 [Saccharomonospora sp. CUA-673]